jgi:hypothetical protein
MDIFKLINIPRKELTSHNQFQTLRLLTFTELIKRIETNGCPLVYTILRERVGHVRPLKEFIPVG